MAKKNYNGITADTSQNLQLGAGVFFKNFTVGTDTYTSAKTAGKCLGATQGGGEFYAAPEFRQVAVDGAIGRVKGLADFNLWTAYIKATLLETTEDTLKLSLAATTETTDSVNGYKKITGAENVESSDYITNLTWLGCIKGSDKPIIIQLYNCLNEDGLTYTVADQNEAKIAITAYGYNALSEFETDSVKPPFMIFYPIETTPTPGPGGSTG